jgi:hypothetical protein
MSVKITKRVKKPTEQVVTVWKMVSDIKPNSWSPWMYHYLRFARGKWVKALDPDYGFNCFTYRKDAIHVLGSLHPVVKCRARLIEGYGTFGGRPVVFAREIFVPKVEKGK